LQGLLALGRRDDDFLERGDVLRTRCASQYGGCDGQGDG
jgi:hypothetical protein